MRRALVATQESPRERMKPQEKIEKIVESGGSAAAFFWRGEFQSLIELWKHEKEIILTWEEAPRGDQYNEHRYTRDERHTFARIEDALAFLEKHSIAFDQFEGTIKRKRGSA